MSELVLYIERESDFEEEFEKNFERDRKRKEKLFSFFPLRICRNKICRKICLIFEFLSLSLSSTLVSQQESLPL